MHIGFLYKHTHARTHARTHAHTHRERKRGRERVHVLICCFFVLIFVTNCLLLLLSLVCWSEYDNKFPKLRRRDAPKPTLESDSQNGENSTIVVYDFTYGNNQYQQTEVKQSLLCPWCVCRCRFKAIHPLLLHLKLDHSVFTFSYMVRDGTYWRVSLDAVTTLCVCPCSPLMEVTRSKCASTIVISACSLIWTGCS